MLGEARWIVSTTASALYWTECFLFENSADAASGDAALAAEARALAVDLAAVGIEPAGFFAYAIPQSVRVPAPRQLAEVVLDKLLGRNRTQSAEPLARRLTTLIGTFDRQAPKLIDELELRSGPIRSQWEARGPGLLAALGRLTETDLVAETAEVILVRPVRGGAGLAFPLSNAIAVEAVLTDAVETLPEVVRIAWLWSQLHLDLPKYQDLVGRDRRRRIGPLAMVPPVIAAAEEVELARLDLSAVQAALEHWRLDRSAADVLLDWWATYQAASPAWGVALAALDKLLPA